MVLLPVQRPHRQEEDWQGAEGVQVHWLQRLEVALQPVREDLRCVANRELPTSNTYQTITPKYHYDHETTA